MEHKGELTVKTSEIINKNSKTIYKLVPIGAILIMEELLENNGGGSKDGTFKENINTDQ